MGTVGPAPKLAAPAPAKTARPPASAPAPAPIGPRPGWTISRALIPIAVLFEIAAALLFHSGDVAAAAAQEGAMLLPAIAFSVVLLFVGRPWVFLVAGILASVLPLMVLLLFGGLFGLTGIDTGWEFATLYLLLWGLFLALPAGILGFVRGRKRRPQRMLRGGWASPQGVYVAAISGFFLMATLAGGFAASHASTAQGTAYDFPVARSVAVTTKDFAFSPRTLEVPLGNVTEIVVTNKETAFHTFTYVSGGTEYSHDIVGGATAKFLVKIDAPGAVQFRCRPHSSGYDDAAGMTGTMNVGAA